MKFKDYYQILGVAKGASAEEVKKAYRKLARKYHPDVSKEADAEQHMADVNEAYAVLGDAEKRAAYDEVGAQAWAQGARSGDDVRPPPGWRGSAHAQGADFSGAEGDFSEFFEQMFGTRRQHAGARGPMRGQDRNAQIELDLADAYHGTERELTLRDARLDASGQVVPETRTLHVKIPKGVKEGQLIRLAGHGGAGVGGGAAGDLLLEVRFRADARWQVDGADVTQRLRLAPWEAALGAQVQLPTPAGTVVEVAVPAGSGAGRKLRLKGRGIPSTPPGDLYLVLDIAVPGAVTPEQKQAWQALASSYPGFDPRAA
ncbi:MAG: J domain-containing protein [Ottowia sp.]|nr:J domain-containing protein [Ottowia sp.]